MQKDFDEWNKIKKEVNAYELRSDFFYHQREVWWCAIGLNVDVETDGKQTNFERPVLVIQKFNKEMFWGVPLTSKERTGKFYEKIVHDKGTAWAMLTQMKTFSSKRLLRKIGMISETDFTKIQERIHELLIRIEPLHKEGALGGRSH
ncbi:MAG: type II toxin-antitoxin system PemK/MazF family toxin [Candidatus Kaiserbacteria bacterium]|nr:type II toxin-antitoxin system PemK/MazF family toxin [Candidatus Kaiserbacteria bacterium]